MKRLSALCTVCLMILLLPLVSVLASTTAPREYAPVQEGFVTAGETALPYAPGHILVKFTKESFTTSRLNKDLQWGAAVPGALTGIASVDALGLDVGATNVSRAFIEPKNRIEALRLGVERWFIVGLPEGADIPAVAERFAADTNIEHAMPDWRLFPAVIPTDPMYPDHWGHNNTAQLPDLDWGGTYDHTLPTTVGTPGFDANAQAAWDASQGFGSSSIIIAILDSGVDIDHPDLNLVAGYDFGDNDSNPDDDSYGGGHGTCCAGVAASMANNGLGACGAAPGCRIMPCKLANSAGSMYFSAMENALYWAADNGADIISMSIGAYYSSYPAVDAAISYAYNAGCLILAATSNDNYTYTSYPANHAYVIAVGAASPCGDRKRSSSNTGELNPGVTADPNGYTCDGERWWGSNYGVTTQDAAGAVDILGPTIVPTTDIGGSGGFRPGDYEPFFNGTSCATPYVAGVCGLIKSQNPAWTPAQIRSQLVTTAIDIVNVESGAGWDRYSGYGMVDAEAAVGGGTCDITADFTVDLPTGCAPLTAIFTDLSTGTGIDGWSWDFGDGVGTSADQNPTYNYTSPGIYTVTLVASSSGQGCSDDEVKVDYITVDGPPVADFSGSPLSGEASLTVNFTDLSTGDPYEWNWDFGDGIGTSTAQNPVYTYNTPGKYTVELTVTGLCGTDIESKFEYITVTEPGQNEKAYAYAETNTYGTVGGDYTNTWASDNSYEVITEVLSTGHPVKTTSWLEHMWELNVPSGTNPIFYLEARRPANGDGDNFLFEYSTDGATYLPLVTVASATEQVYSAGMPAGTDGLVYMRVTDSNRSWGNTSLDAVYVDEMYIEVETTPGPPVADFVGDPRSGFAPLTVTFTDMSTGSPDSWDWNFGDGVGTSIDQNPVYIYNDPGTYTVTLIAGNSYGSDTETKTGYITVSEPGLNVHVSDINVGRRNKAVSWYGQAWVTVVDNDGAPVSGAVVYGYFDAPTTKTKNGTTGSDGVALIEADKTKTPPADYCFTVTDIVYTGADYNPAANLVTKACESGWVYSAGPDLAVQLPQETPKSFVLGQNYPNPFNPVTSIMFGLPEPAHVRLDIFNVKGELVKTLVEGELGSGFHTYEWNAAGVSSGIYFYRILTNTFTETRKMILLR